LFVDTLGERLHPPRDFTRTPCPLRIKEPFDSSALCVNVRIGIKPNEYPLTPERDGEVVIPRLRVVTVRLTLMLTLVDLNGEHRTTNDSSEIDASTVVALTAREQGLIMDECIAVTFDEEITDGYFAGFRSNVLRARIEWEQISKTMGTVPVVTWWWLCSIAVFRNAH
jgi:hypothetical protein